jgi:hypothetical protein
VFTLSPRVFTPAAAQNSFFPFLPTIMTSSFQAPDDNGEQSATSEAFLTCIREEAEIIQAEFDNVTPMIAQARALLWLDTLARLHEAGLDEAIKANDPQQASAWTRDLALFEVVISLIRNIQPMDLGEGDQLDASAPSVAGSAVAASADADDSVVIS